MNLFYKLMVNGIITNLDLRIADCIKTLEQYSFFNDKDKLDIVSKTKTYDQEEFYVKNVKGNKTVYDLFYFNFHIHVSISDNEKIYSIRLKKTDDTWKFKIANINEDIDYSHPVNETYEVYVWYNVPVLDFTNCVGYNYRNGSWDKYFYQTVNKFIKDVNGITDKSKFNEYYK